MLTGPQTFARALTPLAGGVLALCVALALGTGVASAQATGAAETIKNTVISIVQDFTSDPASKNAVNEVRQLGLEAVPPLLELLHHDDWRVRWLAIYGLNGILQQKDVARVAAATGQPESKVLDALAAGLDENNNMTIRVLAAATLLRLGDERGVAALRQATGSEEYMAYSEPPERIAAFAARVLEEFGK